jgi:hypothetical protein
MVHALFCSYNCHFKESFDWFLIVLCESTDNYLMIFVSSKASGIALYDMIVFSEREKQMNRQNWVVRFECTWLNLKKCCCRIVKTVCIDAALMIIT